MTVRTFIILLFSTVIVVAAAAMALIMRPGDQQRANMGRPVLPGLIDRINDVATLRLESTEGGKLTFNHEGKKWTLAERAGYPATTDKLEALAVALARLTYLTAKTTNSKLYGRLHLGDPGKPGTKSVLVTMADRNGKDLGSLIVGTSRSSIEGTPQGGTFVRLPNDFQTWLAKGYVDIGKKVQHWIDRNLFEIKTDRIKRVEIHHPDGEEAIAFKDQKTDEHFILANVPGSKKVTSPYTVDGLASNIGDLVIDDVARREKRPVDATKSVRVVFETFNGLKLTILMEKQHLAVTKTKVAEGTPGEFKDEHWIQVEASGTGDAAAEAEKINARTKTWSYHISDFRYNALAKHMKDLVEDVKPKKDGE